MNAMTFYSRLVCCRKKQIKTQFRGSKQSVERASWSETRQLADSPAFNKTTKKTLLKAKFVSTFKDF